MPDTTTPVTATAAAEADDTGEATLIARATEDSLPGYKTPESIKAVSDLLAAYREDKADQQETTRTKELARPTRKTFTLPLTRPLNL